MHCWSVGVVDEAVMHTPLNSFSTSEDTLSTDAFTGLQLTVRTEMEALTADCDLPSTFPSTIKLTLVSD
jgi:hypothetical protein